MGVGRGGASGGVRGVGARGVGVRGMGARGVGVRAVGARAVGVRAVGARGVGVRGVGQRHRIGRAAQPHDALALSAPLYREPGNVHNVREVDLGAFLESNFWT